MRSNPGPEKRRHRQAPRAQKAPLVDWLPTDDAGFAAWAPAARRAQQELSRAALSYRHDRQLHHLYEVALDLFRYTLVRAYPPGFWEGMPELLAGRAADLDGYIAFLEADPYFFRSGYAKAEVIRGIKRLPLTDEQRHRLQSVVLRVIDSGFRREFRAYCRLARRIQSHEWLREVEARLSSPDSGLALRARWVLDCCRSHSA